MQFLTESFWLVYWLAWAAWVVAAWVVRFTTRAVQRQRRISREFQRRREFLEQQYRTLMTIYDEPRPTHCWVTGEELDDGPSQY